MGIHQAAAESQGKALAIAVDRSPHGERLSGWQERLAKQLISANLNSGLSITKLARECGLSRCHFSRAFHGSTGMSPHQWLTCQRLHRAEELLLGTGSVAEVAQDCGFADQAHFSRVFARHFGVPPSQWRIQQLRLAG